jgi:RNA polymerase sigma-70 factor, ECF subfamily
MMSFLPWRSPTRGRRSQATEGGVGAADAQTQALADLRLGQRAAIGVIYEAEAPRVYRYALALAGNAAWAADATQDAFVALALRPEGFDPTRGPLGAWLAGVARHALAAQWRQALGHEPLADDGERDEAADANAASPEQLMVQAQDQAAVWHALRRLSPVLREAVVLVDLQERPYVEAAAIAGIELNTLRTRLFRGRQRLAVLLGGAGGTQR